jgi:hypothetical protein
VPCRAARRSASTSFWKRSLAERPPTKATTAASPSSQKPGLKKPARPKAASSIWVRGIAPRMRVRIGFQKAAFT